jgi:cytochrome c oxidase assembly factor CtaG/putative copper export protein
MSSRILLRTGPADRLLLIRLLLLGSVLGLAALVICLGLAGGAPLASPAGLPDPGPFTGWGLPVAKLAADLAAILTVGSLLVPTLLLPSRDGELRGPSIVVVHAVRWAALAWFAAVAAQFVLTLSDLLAVPVARLGIADLASFGWQVPQGRALGIQAVLVLIVAFACRWILSIIEALALLAISMAALIPPVLTGHSASSGSHDVAVVSLGVHVLGATLWIGGLIALLWFTALGAKNTGLAVTRFSTLAAWCLSAVLLSGVINAAVRLGSIDVLFTSGYGALVLAKAACLVVIGVFGWVHRQRSIPAFANAPAAAVSWTTFVRLASVEICVMAATVGIAVALSRTPTPVGDVYTSPVESLLGGAFPPAPTIARVILGWTPSGVGLLVVIFGAALYGAGLLAMRRKGNAWPLGRTVSWFVGLLVVAWATFGGLGLYSHVLFSAHMGSHMLLSMVAPIFLVLGAPITLALRTLPGPRVPGERSPRHLLTSLLHSRVVAVLTHPMVATVLFLASLYGLYFTNLFNALMTSHLGHAAMELHFLLVGSLFFYVLVGVDPSPRRLPPFARLALLLIVMPFHAFFSIAVMSSSTPFGEDFFSRLNRPYQQDLLADQNLGGSLSWALGELPIIAVVAAIFIQWLRSDAREAKRLDRRADQQAPGDSDLDAYNRYLSELHAADERASHNPD